MLRFVENDIDVMPLGQRFEGFDKLADTVFDRSLGWKMTGAGGAGYLILASDQPIPNAVRIIARRESE